eukprot:6177139-Pleurochrysis_carterae.AAC.1
MGPVSTWDNLLLLPNLTRIGLARSPAAEGMSTACPWLYGKLLSVLATLFGTYDARDTCRKHYVN